MRIRNKDLLNNIREYVADYCNEVGCGPTVREISAQFNMPIATVHTYLTDLRNQGLLTMGPSKQYEPSEYGADRDTVQIGIIGAISCGPLAEAQQEERGYVRLPRSLVGKGKFYFLEASGDSMINAGIDNGDLILFRATQEAEIGQIVVAKCDNEVTLKRLCYDKKKRAKYLHPENGNYADIYAPTIEIQGVVAKIIKEPK